MDNDKKLVEGLLKADGIDPANITESERMVFRQMLDSEQKRMKHLSWFSVGAVWIFALAMIGLCVSENILETLHIPFVVGCLVVMAAMLIVMIRYMPGHNRKLKESNRKISKLYYLVHGKHRGLILIGKKDGKRIINWPSLLKFTVVSWLIVSLSGAGVYYLLCQCWIYSSSPMLHIFYCAVVSLSFVIFLLRDGLKTPLDELVEIKPKSKQSKPVYRPDIWRIIMNSKITKFAAAAVILIAILIGLNQFGGSVDGSSVAFGQVLEYLQTYSYSFDLTGIEDQDQKANIIQGMVWEAGKMRLDFSRVIVGKISSITDLNSGNGLLLFHHDKTAVAKKEFLLNKNTGAGGIVSFCTKPVENLWDLRDGTEEQLGEKEIDGQHVTGFKVFQEDEFFEYEITIWADFDSGVPFMVEQLAKPLDESNLSIKWTMKNFDLDIELDEGLFSLEVPAGYTLAYQEDLENLEVKTEASSESEKIVQVLELWSQSRENEAIGLLLEVDWTKRIEFGKEPYIFSVSEKAYKSLKADDQKRVIKEISASMASVKAIVKEVLTKGKAAAAQKKYKQAEQYFNAGYQLGRLLERDPERMIIPRLIGIGACTKTSKEMIILYKTTNDHEKLQEAEKQLRAAEAELDKIKKQAADR